MSLRKQRICECCNRFTQNKGLCVQCLHAGCDQKKKREKCYVLLGAAAPKAHVAPAELLQEETRTL
jgi:hypothetical protein